MLFYLDARVESMYVHLKGVYETYKPNQGNDQRVLTAPHCVARAARSDASTPAEVARDILLILALLPKSLALVSSERSDHAGERQVLRVA
jgi:hypothetical protein